MSDYAKVNIKQELDNMAEQYGIEGFEARFARKALDLEQFGFSYQKFGPDWRQPFGHRHAGQEEVYVVLEGGGRIKVEDEVVELRRWDSIRIPSGVMRQLESGPDGLEILAIGGTPSGDAEIIEGWWAD
jgi:mannose-6-phosphate isomerase-like protein (cupin superfamily)